MHLNGKYVCHCKMIKVLVNNYAILLYVVKILMKVEVAIGYYCSFVHTEEHFVPLKSRCILIFPK